MSEGWLKTMKNPSNAVDSKEMLKVNTLFLFFPGNPWVKLFTQIYLFCHLRSQRHFSSFSLELALVQATFDIETVLEYIFINFYKIESLSYFFATVIYS